LHQQNRVDNFLKVVSNSKATEYTYKCALKKFFQWALRTTEDIDLEKVADAYFKQKRNYEDDVEGFYAAIKDNPPKSVNTWLAVVKSFLIENDVELSQKFWRRINRRFKSTRAVTEDIVPSNEQLRSILVHTTAKGKALLLVLASSGMRIGETLKLRLSDIDLTLKPTRIKIVAGSSKTGGWRYTFISQEATEALQEWLKIRDKAYKRAIGRGNHAPPRGEAPKQSSTDERIFPFTEENAYAILNNALDNAQLNHIDEATNRHKIHPHVLRKFFRSRMATIIPVDIVEAIMGHEGYLTEVYRRYTVEQLAEFYKKGESSVTIFGQTSEDLEKLRREVLQDKEQLQKIVNGLNVENLYLKEKVQKLETAVDTLVHNVRRFQEETLKRMGDSPEQIREAMQKHATQRKEFLSQ
jgi:integrase